MPVTGVCDPPSPLPPLSPPPAHSSSLSRSIARHCCSAAVVFRQSAASSSSGSHRGSGHRRLPPFPAGGAVQQELSLSVLLEGRQLEEFTEALAEPMAENFFESSSLKLPSPGNSRDTKMDERGDH
jgi:hypothetical protein